MSLSKKIDQRYIKNENRKWLIIYLLIQIVLFALFAGNSSFNLTNADQLITKIKNTQGFIPLSVAILIIVMEGIFKNSIKEFLVFWRFKNRLPGHRAFSHICPKDPRIDMEKVQLLFPHGIPSAPKEQNNEWYNIYRKYQNEILVFYAHKAYLLTRDLASLTVVLLPFVLAGHFIMGTKASMITYHLIILVVLYIVTSFSSRNYGERFVANVVIEAINRQN
jgi:hypothetical protein